MESYPPVLDFDSVLSMYVAVLVGSWLVLHVCLSNVVLVSINDELTSVVVYGNTHLLFIAPLKN